MLSNSEERLQCDDDDCVCVCVSADVFCSLLKPRVCFDGDRVHRGRERSHSCAMFALANRHIQDTKTHYLSARGPVECVYYEVSLFNVTHTRVRLVSLGERVVCLLSV